MFIKGVHVSIRDTFVCLSILIPMYACDYLATSLLNVDYTPSTVAGHRRFISGFHAAILSNDSLRLAPGYQPQCGECIEDVLRN